jgi:TonB family protein
MRHIKFSALACALLSTTAQAQTQAAAPDAPTAAPDAASDSKSTPAAAEPAQAMTPPRLLQSVEPVYPEAQRQSGQAASVGLLLTLDAQGRVSDASVAQSGGADFDDAALAAARNLVFAPALHGETPVASRIAFRFEFRLEPPSVPVAALSPAPPQPGEPLALTPAVPPANAEASLDIDVEGERPPREPTRRVLEAQEITKIPGTNGDALRAVQNLPGIARPPGLDGALIVRGSSPQDSQVFIDKTNVPIVYHFGGLSSVVPSEMLERIDFYPGNFGPEYGRASGGVIDVGVRSPKKEGYGGLFQIDLLDGRLIAEGAITPDTRIMLGGRRSWVDAWLGPVLEQSGADVSTAPVYYDYQAMIEHDVSHETTLRLFAFGSDDRLELLLKSPDASDPAQGGGVSLHTGFWRVQGRVDTRLSSNTRWTTTLAVGKDTAQFGVGNLDIDTGIYALDLRSDLRAQLLPELALSGGLDIQTGSYDVSWHLPPLDFEDNGSDGPLFGRPLTELSGTGKIFRPSAYAQAEISPIKGLKLLPGVRTDYTHDTEAWTVDPRLGMRYDLVPGEHRTTLKGGVGIFHQPPEPYESVQPFGTPGVRSERAIHYSLGIEHEFSRPLELSLEGFYKDLGQLVQATPAAQESESGITYRNNGSGRSYGGELLLRYKPEGRFFGWVAYTLSRSERKDSPEAPYALFDYDQTHILTALGSVKLGRGWQLGARFRYVTGSPYTPNVRGILDYDAGAYAPVEASERNASRLPAFHQLDVRVDKTWQFESWRLSAYLDVQNAYNRKNTENISYNYDYTQTKPLPGLPILPVLGFRGEL